MQVRVAAIQVNSGSDIASNIARLDALVAQAAARLVQLVALPENCFQMEEPGQKSKNQGAERRFYTMDDHPGVAAASRMAQTHHIWLLVGSLAIKIDDSGKAVNRSLLLGDKGQLVASYDKIHLFDVELPGGDTYLESARMLPGDRAVVAQTPWGGLGMTVCYDVRFPHLYRALAKGGADMLAVPSAFTHVTGEAHWHTLLRARAIENGCFVIAPAQVGTHPGKRKTYGHALIIDPWGKVLADAGTEEGIIVADIDIKQVGEVRARIPSLQHDRPFEMESAGY